MTHCFRWNISGLVLFPFIHFPEDDEQQYSALEILFQQVGILTNIFVYKNSFKKRKWWMYIFFAVCCGWITHFFNVHMGWIIASRLDNKAKSFKSLITIKVFFVAVEKKFNKSFVKRLMSCVEFSYLWLIDWLTIPLRKKCRHNLNIESHAVSFETIASIHFEIFILILFLRMTPILEKRMDPETKYRWW